MTKAATVTKVDQPKKEETSLAVYATRSRLPYYDSFKERFGVDQGQWDALINSCYPSAKTVASVVMVLDYCKARGLDPFKRPVHIVPMYQAGDYDPQTKKKTPGRYLDTVWPGIAEVRTTAHRTKDYAGCDPAEYGPEKTFEWTLDTDDGQGGLSKRKVAVTAPEWMRYTLYRVVGGVRCPFAGPRVRWMEAYATMGRTDVPNQMWQDRPEGQLDKCAEAAAIRRAFPEEAGNIYAAEEMAGRKIIGESIAGVPQIDAAPEPEPPKEPAKKKVPPPAIRPTTPAAEPVAAEEETPTSVSSQPPLDTSSPGTQTQDGGATTASPTEEVEADLIDETPSENEAVTLYIEDLLNAATPQALKAIREDVIKDEKLTDEDRLALRDPYKVAYERITGKKQKEPPPAALGK